MTMSIRYPWDKWFEKSQFTLQKGRDYSCQNHSMAVMIRTAANSRGLSVRLRTEREQIHVTLYEIPDA